MDPFCKGQFRARLAKSPEDIRAAQRLRYLAFRGGRAGAGRVDEALDRDALDDRCQHLIVETISGDEIVGTCRLFLIRDPKELALSYSAQFYDLPTPSALIGGPRLEIGRFCLSPHLRDTDGLRLAWAALTRIVEGAGVARMFGCSSFVGVEIGAHADALAMLATHHQGPVEDRPGRKAPETVPLIPGGHDPRRALMQMPPLLRSYLAMGGWVSDHAVIDRDLNTLHVFTAVDIAAIPPARARLLRADAS